MSNVKGPHSWYKIHQSSLRVRAALCLSLTGMLILAGCGGTGLSGVEGLVGEVSGIMQNAQGDGGGSSGEFSQQDLTGAWRVAVTLQYQGVSYPFGGDNLTVDSAGNVIKLNGSAGGTATITPTGAATFTMSDPALGTIQLMGQMSSGKNEIIVSQVVLSGSSQGDGSFPCTGTLTKNSSTSTATGSTNDADGASDAFAQQDLAGVWGETSLTMKDPTGSQSPQSIPFPGMRIDSNGNVMNLNGSTAGLTALISSTGAVTFTMSDPAMGTMQLIGQMSPGKNEIIMSKFVLSGNSQLNASMSLTGTLTKTGDLPTPTPTPTPTSGNNGGVSPDNSFRLLATTGSGGSHPFSLVELLTNTSSEKLLCANQNKFFAFLEMGPDGRFYAGYDTLYSALPGSTVFKNHGVVHTNSVTKMSLNGIAFAPDGTLYGVAKGIDYSNSVLYTIDLGTALATKVGDIPEYLNGIDFRPDGTLYGAGYELVRLDPKTGQILETIMDLGFQKNVVEIDIAPDGFIYGLHHEYSTSGATSTMVYRIDPTNRTADLVGTYPYSFWGIASQVLPVTSTSTAKVWMQEDTPMDPVDLEQAKLDARKAQEEQAAARRARSNEAP